MAIVKMKRLRLIALNSQKEDLLARLLHLGCVELSDPQEEMNDPDWNALLHRSESDLSDVRQDLARATAALQTLDRYAPAKGSLFKERETLKEAEFFSEETLKKNLDCAEQINSREKEITDLQAQENRVNAAMGGLRPWTGLDVALDVASTANVRIGLAVCPAAVDMGALAKDLADAAPMSQVVESSTDTDQHYFLVLCHKSQTEAADEVLKAYGVTNAAFKDVTGTAADNLAALEAELTEIGQKRETLQAEIAGMGENRQGLQICIDRLNQEVAKQEVAQRAVTDDTILYYNGWMVADQVAQVEAELAKFTCAWEIADPVEEEYPQVPVKLKSNKLTQPLNMVTDMYVYPAYDGVDPNPLMAPFFIFFFGMMMADMGYGLAMLIGGWFLIKKMHVRGTLYNMGGLAILCGISTLVFGALTGGFFGDFIPQLLKIINPESTFQLPYLFTPLTDTLTILIGSLILGFIQIVTGMTVSVVRKIKSGNFIDALFDEISWWIILAGGALAIFGIGTVGGVPVVLAIGGLMLTVGGTREAKGFGKVSKWIGIVYNGISGFFSDTLSYARLMALMLAGAVIAQVFNTLGAVTGNVIGFVIISLIGNVLNLALNLLGCYVHDLRLQCLEFFGRFYKEGGKPFAPLTFNTKYVDIIKEEN